MSNNSKMWIVGATLISALALSANDVQALPAQTVFTAAGLGNASDWTIVPSPSVWGTGGNGFFPVGGSAEFELRLADLNHRFGTVTPGLGAFNVIFNTTINSQGDTTTWTPIANPFLFFAQNLTPGHHARAVQ